MCPRHPTSGVHPSEQLRVAIDAMGARGHRTGLVVVGARAAAARYTQAVFDAVGVGVTDRCLISDAPTGVGPTVAPAEMERRLGQGFAGVAYDGTGGIDPDVLGQAVGTVEGGGVCLVWVGPRAALRTPRGRLATSMGVAPWTVADVGTRFPRRLVRTATEHPGIGVIDLEDPTQTVHPVATPAGDTPPVATTHVGVSAVAPAVTRLVRTADQRRAVDRICQLPEGSVAVVEARRGRGKSTALAIAAMLLARDGAHVVLTATARGHLAAAEAQLRALCDRASDGRYCVDAGGSVTVTTLEAALPDGGDAILMIDEAATVPIDRLWRLIGDRRVVLSTTTDGYEGTGAGFGVRLADRLRAAELDYHHITLSTPIRFAPADPLERWITRLLCLDAAPLRDLDRIMDRGPLRIEGVSQRQLAADESLLRGVRALLADAHYQTTPADLARWLDAPNIRLWVAHADPIIAGVAATAEEGRLDQQMIDSAVAGHHIPGQLFPDVFMRQVGDHTIGRLHTRRVMRVAVHPELRRRGIATALIEAAAEPSTLDGLTAVYGATSATVHFWTAVGFVPVHIAARPNPRSGVHSVFMIRPRSAAARRWTGRAERAFIRRLPGLAPDHLRRMDAAVLAAICAAASPQPVPAWPADTWRQLRRIGRDDSVYASAPHAVRRLLLTWLTHRSIAETSAAAVAAVGVACQGRSMRWAVEAGHVRSPRAGWSQLASTIAEAVDTLSAAAPPTTPQRWAK